MPQSIPLDITEARQPRSNAARTVLEKAEVSKATRDGLGGIKGLQIGKSDTYEVSPFDIHVKPGWNTRDFSTEENQDHVLTLAHSIASRGVQVPLTVYYEDGKLWLSDGESRLRGTYYAINELNAPILSVPVRTEGRGSNDAERVLGQLVRNSGKTLTPLEKAQVVRRLLNYGWTPEQIAGEWGATVETVRRLIEMLEMPEAIRQQVQSGAVAATEAVRIVKKHGEAAPEIVDRAVALASENGGKKKRATRATLEAVEREREPERQDAADEMATGLERALMENAALQETVDLLTSSDQARELVSLQAKYAQLNARVQQLLTEAGEAKRRADSFGKTLKSIRDVLVVETNGEILGAIHDLKQ